MHARTIPAFAALAGIVIAGCSGDDATEPAPTPARDATSTPAPGTAARTSDPAPPSTSPVTSAPTSVAPGGAAGLATGAAFSVLGALEEVPDGGEAQFEVSTGDIAAVSEMFGLSRPDSVADVDAVLNDWILPLTFPGQPEYRELPVWLPLTEPLLPMNVSLLGEFDEVAGWSVADVDAYVHYLPPPPGSLLATVGSFDDDALAGLAEVAPGVATTREGDDFAVDPTQISAFDQLGRPVRMARDGDRLAVSLATPMLEAWLAGSTATLADDSRLAAVATALDDAGVLTAQLFRSDFVFNPGAAGRLTPEQVAEVTEGFPVTVPFDTVGIGWTVRDDGAPATVLAFAPIGSADELAEQLQVAFAEGASIVTQQPLADTIGAVDPEIAVEADVVTVTYQPVERFWFSAVQALYQRDLPFVHL